MLRACQYGHLECVRAIAHLASPSVVNDTDDNARTPMMHAAAAGHKEVVKVLISYGADVATTNKTGKVASDLARTGRFGDGESS